MPDADLPRRPSLAFGVVAAALLAAWPLARWLRAEPEPAPAPAAPPPLAFTFTDAEGRPFGTAQLQGHRWVGAVVCTACPSRDATLERLRALQAQVGPCVELVAFSVDPDADRPEALRAVGAELEPRWHLLTAERDDLHLLLVEGPWAGEGDGTLRGLQTSTRVLRVDAAGTHGVHRDAAALAADDEAFVSCQTPAR